MNKIIITDKPEKYSNISEDVRIINVSTFVERCPETWSNYNHEFIPYCICDSISESNPVIAIDYSIINPDKYIIAHHAITTLKATLLFVSDEKPLNLHLENDFGLFKNKAIKFLTNDQLKKLFIDNEELIRISKVYQDDFDYVVYKKNYQRFLEIDRHQTINEWGATKLLLNHGLTLTEIESSFQLPKTIYFKQKLLENKIDYKTIVNIGPHPKEKNIIEERNKFQTNCKKIKNILLIDDNANKGWEFALKKIFTSAKLNVKLHFEDAIQITDYSIYDFIFLDLRLPTNSEIKIPIIENGLLLIEKIKGNEKSLHVPLIVFTASQKAQTLDKILEKGADGMYIKEATETNFVESLYNYLDFISEVNVQIEKGIELKKYWTNIIGLKKILLAEVKDSGVSKFETKVNERFLMFYGLLKKGFEQKSYDSDRFLFSNYELAFITLWSVFNEIQEAYFKKNKPFVITDLVDNSGKKTHPSGKPIKNFYPNLENWVLRADTSCELIKIKFEFMKDDSGNIRTKGDQYLFVEKSVYNIESNPKNKLIYSTTRGKFNPNKNISLQIAYILLKHPVLINETAYRDSLLKHLYDINNFRNGLYFTHGEELGSKFYYKTQKEKIEDSSYIERLKNNIEILFNIVSYTLSGKKDIKI